MDDSLGDRMKLYENVEARRKFMPMIPVIARIDGVGFHNFTKGLKLPYDVEFREAMVQTTLKLVEHTHALIGYTQSDEISLIWYSDDPKKQNWFDSRITKMTSNLSAAATIFFYREVVKRLGPEYADRLPKFDSRVYQVPTLTEAANYLVWREKDATKNSITAAASTMYSHQTLDKKSSSEKQELLFRKGINWNDYPASFKRGVYVQRGIVEMAFTVEDIEALPPMHAARSNPNLTTKRRVLRVLDMPQLTKVANRVGVIFNGEPPRLNTLENGSSLDTSAWTGQQPYLKHKLDSLKDSYGSK